LTDGCRFTSALTSQTTGAFSVAAPRVGAAVGWTDVWWATDEPSRPATGDMHAGRRADPTQQDQDDKDDGCDEKQRDHHSEELQRLAHPTFLRTLPPSRSHPTRPPSLRIGTRPLGSRGASQRLPSFRDLTATCSSTAPTIALAANRDTECNGE